MIVTLVLGCAACLLPQDESVRGRVRDEQGAGIAGARVTFATLPLPAPQRADRKGQYRLAPALHLQAARLPKTVTDAEGCFHVLLSPAQQALCGAHAHELELRIQAPGHHEWRRAIGTDLRTADGVDAVLSRAPRRPPLELRCAVAGAPARGFVAVERAFRVRGNRTVWLRELRPLEGGRADFGEPPLVPGELEATTPVVREEAYRVTVYAAGGQEQRRLLPPGAHDLQLVPAEAARKVVGARAEPARGPVRVTWRLDSEDVELEFAEAVVPLLGGRVPVKAVTAAGPVAIDTWDPDVPLFLGEAVEPAAARTRPPPAGPFGQLALEVSDARGTPVTNAGLWLEDAAVSELAADGTPYAVTDADGRATLRGVRAGAWRVLVRHPLAGEREATFTFGEDPEPQTLKLRAQARGAAEAAVARGVLRIDLGPPAEVAGGAEVGVVGPDRRLIRRSFPQRPQHLRVDGLVPGPTTLYVRADGRTVFFGGVLPGSGKEPALLPREVEPVLVRLQVRRANGEPAAECTLGVEDRPPAKAPAAASKLFDVQRGSAPGEFAVSLRLQGTLWLRVHSGDEAADVACAAQAGGPLAVQLRAPPPKPEPKAGTDK